MRRFIAEMFARVAAIFIAGVASAAPTMTVEVGLGDAHRAGRWNPVYITLADNATRGVILELSAAHTGNATMLVRQHLTIGPSAATYPIYVPLGQGIDGLKFAMAERVLASPAV